MHENAHLDVLKQRVKKKGYSSGANIGSQEGSRMGFCCMRARMSAGTYFFSTTRRNMYSLNHSSVMMILPM